MHPSTASWFLAGLIRRSWLVALVTAIVCVGFAAHAVAALAEARYLGPPLHGAAPLAPARVASPRTPPDAGTLVARDMFCSTCVPGGGGPAPADLYDPPAILIATSMGEAPRATLRVPASELQGSFGVGDALLGIGTIEHIGWASVDVRAADGRTGRIRLAASRAADRGDAGAATPAPAAAAGPWAGRIRAVGDHAFEVDRALVRDLVRGGARPGRLRIDPISRGGKLAGIRLRGVGPGSLFATLGLRDGDTLTAIDGTPIRSIQTLIDLYARLGQLHAVELQGTRGGKPLAIDLILK